ncbi:MAG TPA: alpha/beta hydrolase-fold protein [Candidatus Baltobacteraceae bacterium]|nr:alpha/beta hydrolase-fold protein [Candidatus Baltobacteraceae bacterium]
MFAPAVAAVTLFALGSAPSWKLPVSIMRGRLVAQSPLIRALGVNPRDFVFRLDYLAGKLASDEGARQEAPRRVDLEVQAKLELKLDAELLLNLCPTFGAVRGLDESFYNDDPRAPPDPVAFYVPKPDAAGRYAAVVLLHGRTQTETDVVSRSVLLKLADATHAILIAPWGTGSALWGRAAGDEIVAILNDVEREFPIDRQRVYLAGLALGGSSAYRLAARNPSRFHAVLSIGGALLPGDAFVFAHGFLGHAIYVVGADSTYDALASACLPVSDYRLGAVSDAFYAAIPEIEQAWNDMFDGVIRNDNTRECSSS